MKQKKIELMMAVLLILAAILLSTNAVRITNNGKVQKKDYIIVIDAGHGGNDPGKVGVNNVNEKDLNLAIAKKLQKLLKDAGIQVVMTREEDSGLYGDGNNKKVEDMRNRCTIIDESKADFTISIHQNSYHQENVKGAQVFYYEHSDEGKVLAEILQKKLVEGLDPSNKRKAKSNDSYYLLRKTKSPTVIVECGFLSNWEDTKKLVTEQYQEEVAQAIFDGIIEYIKK